MGLLCRQFPHPSNGGPVPVMGPVMISTRSRLSWWGSSTSSAFLLVDRTFFRNQGLSSPHISSILLEEGCKMGLMVGVGRKVNEERARSALFGRKVNEERVRSARHGTKILVARHGFGGLPAVADGSMQGADQSHEVRRPPRASYPSLPPACCPDHPPWVALAALVVAQLTRV